MKTMTIAAVTVLAVALVPALAQDGPQVAYLKPMPDYPLHVHILTAERHSHHSHHILETESYGSGNLLGDEVKGFDWNANTCPGGFMHNAQHEEFYQGKWKKQDQKIEILTMEPGQTRPEKCTISVTLRDKPYGKDNPPPRLVTSKGHAD